MFCLTPRQIRAERCLQGVCWAQKAGCRADRSFEKAQAGKLEKCDLLEVYNSHDQKQIKQKELRLQDKWSMFDGGIDNKNKNELKINENVSSLDFGEDSDDDDYFTNPNTNTNTNANRVVNSNNQDEDVVEVEDI